MTCKRHGRLGNGGRSVRIEDNESPRNVFRRSPRTPYEDPDPRVWENSIKRSYPAFPGHESVISVIDIELPMHLMPKFGNVLGEAAKAKRAMDEAKENDRIWRHSNNYCGSKTWNMTDFILNYCDEF